MYVNVLSTYSDKKSCHTSITLQTSIARFVSDSWASCFINSTAASDLLVHKIMLNSVLLSPIVSGGVRQTTPTGQTPLGHNPLVYCLSWVGWSQDPQSWIGYGQEYGLVSVFYKIPAGFCPTMSYGNRKRGLWPRVLCPGGVLPPFQRITSIPSQTLRRRLVRTTNDGRRRECSARRLPPFVAALFFTLRDSYGW